MKKLILFVLIAQALFAYEINDSIINEKYFNSCDQILENNTFRSCYDYNYKGVTASFAYYFGEDVDSINIAKRPNFYEDTRIPQQYRVKTIDYYYINMDKGHIQSDASNDYSESALEETYALTNSVPMYARTNRISYLYVEKRERELAKEFGLIKVLTVVEYTSQKINGMFIPKEFIKVFFNGSFSECYKIKNDNNTYTLDQMKIECNY